MPSRTKEQKRLEAQERQARAKQKRDLEQRIAQLEGQIAEKEKRGAEVLAILQNPDTWSDASKAMTLQKEHDELDAALQKLTAEWEQKLSVMETFSAD